MLKYLKSKWPTNEIKIFDQMRYYCLPTILFHEQQEALVTQFDFSSFSIWPFILMNSLCLINLKVLIKRYVITMNVVTMKDL